MSIDFAEVQEELDMEFFLDREAIPYRLTRGRSGDQLQIKDCPKCGDTKWKTYFGVDTGKGNCFKCSEPYSKISFIREYVGGNWIAARTLMEEVMREQGWRPKRMVTAAVEAGEVKLPTSMELPTTDGQNLQYLEDRGFTSAISAYFHLRYCEFGWWIFKDDDGATQTQTFSNRVIIPVYDLDGTLKTFQGRDLAGTSDRKYLFPVKLPGTGRFLFNGQNVLGADEVVMGEGAFDVAAIKVAFDQDPTLRHIVPVGSFGKHLSYGSQDGNDQLGRFIQLKSKGLKTVTIMWDGEPSALEAALFAGKQLTAAGLTARIALLPTGADPNEVPGEVVRAAYRDAKTWTASLDVLLRLRNPYGKRTR